MTCMSDLSRRHVLGLALAAAGTATLGRGARAEPISVAAAYGQTTLYNAPIWIAKERGIFSKYGLAVDLVQLTGARITQGLVSNSVQFISGSASSSFLANLSGADTLAIGATLVKLPWDFVTTSKITKLADVKGKIGALALRGDFTEVAIKIALKNAGLDGNRDVSLVQGFGTDADRIAALLGGSADFTVVDSDFRAQYTAAGLNNLFSMMDVKSDFIMSGIFTTRSFAQKNPAAVRGYMQAMSEALALMLRDEDTTVQVCAKYSKRPADELRPTYARYKGYMQRIPAVTAASVAASLDAIASVNPKAATANPADFFDSSYVDTLKAEGFYRQLGVEG